MNLKYLHESFHALARSNPRSAKKHILALLHPAIDMERDVQDKYMKLIYEAAGRAMFSNAYAVAEIEYEVTMLLNPKDPWIKEYLCR